MVQNNNDEEDKVKKKYLVGNWKMNNTLGESINLLSDLHFFIVNKNKEDIFMAVSPSFLHLYPLKEKFNIPLVAQNFYHEDKGPFTGEVSYSMLKDIGVNMVLLGHSERRQLFFESNELLRKKLLVALEAGFQVIFCVGEDIQSRQEGSYLNKIKTQIQDSLFPLEDTYFGKVVIAYEPIWAIGTGKVATLAQIEEVHNFIATYVLKEYNPKLELLTSLLYGGSVTDENCSEIFNITNVDGALVGGASLNSKKFINIYESLSLN